jgi:DNA-binding transcriptional ArsR family regulator
VVTDEDWATIADPSRRAILEQLAEQPRAVGELTDRLSISRPAVSQHLKVLREAGLVTERPEGTRRIYRVDPIALAALRDQLDTFWARTLTAYADTVAADVESEEPS